MNLKEAVFEAERTLTEPGVLHATARSRLPETDEAAQLLLYSLLYSLSDIIASNSQHRLRDERPELDKCRFHAGTLGMAFAMLSGYIPNALTIVRE